MRGARLPGGFDNVDAECYAILQELRTTLMTGRWRKKRTRRMSDCLSSVTAQGWSHRLKRRIGQTRMGYSGLGKWVRCWRLYVNTAISWVWWWSCGCRRTNEGVAPNAYADAIAKGARHRLAEGDKGGAYTRDGANGCAACLAARWR